MEAIKLMEALRPLDAAAEVRGLALDPAWVHTRLDFLISREAIPSPTGGRVRERVGLWSLLSPLAGALAAAVLVFGLRTRTPLTAEIAEVAEKPALENTLPFSGGGEGGGTKPKPAPALASRPFGTVPIPSSSEGRIGTVPAVEQETVPVVSSAPRPVVVSPVGSDRPLAKALPLSGGGLGEGSAPSRSHSASRPGDTLPPSGGGEGEGDEPLSLKVFNSLLDQPGETALIEVHSADSVRVLVFDRRGRKVLSLFEGEASANHEIRWDGRDSRGAEVPSGIYLIVAESGNLRSTAKVTVKK